MLQYISPPQATYQGFMITLSNFGRTVWISWCPGLRSFSSLSRSSSYMQSFSALHIRWWSW